MEEEGYIFDVNDYNDNITYNMPSPYKPEIIMLRLLMILEIIHKKFPIPFFGEIDGISIKMPIRSNDGRQLTWEKLIKNYCNKIQNSPENQQWCWLVPANHKGGGTSFEWSCKHKINVSGNGNHQDIGKMFYMLLTNVFGDVGKNCVPEYYIAFLLSVSDQLYSPLIPMNTILNDLLPTYRHHEANMSQIAAHLCRNGRGNASKAPVCINPWHIIFTNQKVNIDQNKCAHGSRQLCPHGNCIWNWSDNGQPKNCYNLGKDPNKCQFIKRKRYGRRRIYF